MEDLKSRYYYTYLFSDLNEPTLTIEEIKAITS